MKIEVKDANENATPELLPCPFCGSDKIHIQALSTLPDCWIQCEGCGANIEKKVPWGVDLSEKQHDDLCADVLRRVWNTRKGKL